MIQNSVVVKKLQPDQIDANQFIILIAVGIAMIVVTEV
jgi:hypothetical protein